MATIHWRGKIAHIHYLSREGGVQRGGKERSLYLFEQVYLFPGLAIFVDVPSVEWESEYASF